jgi:hypothetical protein
MPLVVLVYLVQLTELQHFVLVAVAVDARIEPTLVVMAEVETVRALREHFKMEQMV